MAIVVSGWNIYSFIINWHHNLNPLLERQPTVDDKCITKIRCVLYLNMKKSCKEKGKWLPQLTGQMAHPARAFKTPWLTRVTKIDIRQPESKPPSHFNACTYADFWPHCPPGQDTSPIQGHPHFFRLFQSTGLRHLFIYFWVERGSMEVKCLAKEHITATTSTFKHINH